MNRAVVGLEAAAWRHRCQRKRPLRSLPPSCRAPLTAHNSIFLSDKNRSNQLDYILHLLLLLLLLLLREGRGGSGGEGGREINRIDAPQEMDVYRFRWLRCFVPLLKYRLLDGR